MVLETILEKKMAGKLPGKSLVIWKIIVNGDHFNGLYISDFIEV